MALEGTLKDVGLSDIFQLLSLQKKNGILTVFRAKEVVTVSFEKGQVVFADEFQRSEQERLGAVLLKSKLITPQQLLKAVELQKQTLQKLGYILVNNAFLSQEDLKKALQRQVRETVFKLFRWDDGQFKFSQEPVVYDDAFYQPIPSDFLVMEGIRRIDEWPLIKKKVPNMQVIFSRTEMAEEKIGEEAGEGSAEDLDDILSFVDDGDLGKPVSEEKKGYKLSSAERVIFSLVDGRRSVENIIDEGRMGEFETCKSLFSLLSLGLIKKIAEASEQVDKKSAGRESYFLKKAMAGLTAIIVALLIMAVNPLSPIRGWETGRESISEMGSVTDRMRVDRVKFALLCYYLERKTYPSSLFELVQADLLKADDIYDHRNDEFFYLREENGYSLRSADGYDTGGSINIRPGQSRK